MKIYLSLYGVILTLMMKYGRSAFVIIGNECPRLCRCISKGKGGNIVTVDCCGSGITEIPGNIPPSAVSLHLCNNSIYDIKPRAFQELSLLENLDLSGNMVTFLNRDSLLGLWNLKNLSIANNLLRSNNSYPLGVFRELRHLRVLKISGNFDFDVSWDYYYPDHVFRDVPGLTELYLDGIADRALGPGFRYLLKLEKLYFGNGNRRFCRMTQISKSTFENLWNSSVWGLTLARCYINIVEEGVFSSLKNLTRLILIHNRELCLPGFLNITNGLNRTKIQYIQAREMCKKNSDICTFELPNNAFNHLTATELEHLEITSSCLRKVSQKALLGLPKSLRYLSFRDNDLLSASFLEHLDCLQNLQTLDISYQLSYRKSVSNNEDVQSLQEAGLQVFRLTGKKRVIAKCYGYSKVNSTTERRLKELLQFHKASLCADVTIPRSLKYVYGSHLKLGFPIPSLTFSPNQVQILDLSYNMIPDIFGKLYGLTSLVILNLSCNGIQFIHPETFGDMANLTNLLLGNNALGKTVLYDEKGRLFSNLTRLQTLDLSDNSIRDLPKTIFDHQSRLRVLTLRNNSIAEIHFDLGGMQSLEDLDLSFNVLQTLTHEQTISLDRIAQDHKLNVYLNGNNLQCKCNNMDFLKWLVKTDVKFVKKESTFCKLYNGTTLTLVKADDILSFLELTCYSWVVVTACVLTFVLSLLVLSLVAVTYHKRWKLRYLYYMGRRNMNPYHHLIGENIDMKYDIYISYDRDFMINENKTLHDFVTKEIYPALKGRGYSLVIRDELQSGKMLHDVISGAVLVSTKVLALMTSEFIKDFWNTFEVNMAAYEGIYTRRKVVVPIVFGPVNAGDFTPEILELLRAEPVIQYSTSVDLNTFILAIEEKMRS